MTEFRVVGPKVLDYVDAFAPEHAFDEFYDLLELLTTGPNPEDQPGAGLLPMQDPDMPNAFTAPFDAGLLSYQVMKDHPLVVLIDVFWIDEPEGAGHSF